MQGQNKREILLRLRRIEGQVRGLQNMVEEQADCAEILNQVSAVKAAVNQAGILIFKNHARQCLARSLTVEEDLEEIIKTMSRLIK